MDRLTETATTNPHQVISTAVTIFGNIVRTFSTFVKKGNVRYIQIANVAFGDSSASAIFDLDTKTVTASRASSGAGPAFTFVNAYVEDYGNGILRLVLVNTCSFDAASYRIAHSNQATFTGATLVDGMVSYAGNASSFTDLWGAQLEAGAYGTSYVKTEAAAVTRLADAASKTGISSLIGQTEGTIYWEGQISSTTGFPQLCDLNADGNKFIQIYNALVSGAPRIGLYIQNVSLLLNAGNIATISFDTNFKFALAYKNNDYAAYLNGNLVYTNTTIGVPPTSNFGIGAAGQGAESSGKKVAQTLLFKTRLTNAQLAELTTL
jgi:hypothetical protein